MNQSNHLLLGLSGASLALTGIGYAMNGKVEPSNTNEPQATRAPEAGLAWGDVDGDGLDDVLVVDAQAGARLMLAFGEGRFEDVTEVAGLGSHARATCALLSDLDGDGDTDLVLGSAGTRLWRNLGDGTFEATESGLDHDLVDFSFTAVDRDQDGRLDLEVHTEAGELVYRNAGDARFERVELPLVGGAASAWGTTAVVPAVENTPTDPVARAQRVETRFERWSAQRTLAGSGTTSSLTTGSSGSLGTFLGALPCTGAVADAAGGPCLEASSVPTTGSLLPLGSYIDVGGTGEVTFGLPSISGSIQVSSPGGAPGFIAFPNDAGEPGAIAWTDDGLSFDSGTGGTDVFLNDGGDLGVGTTSPTARLHVDGGGFLLTDPAGTNYGHQVSISTPSSANNIGIALTRGDGAGGSDRRWDVYVPSDNGFRIRDNNANADRLTIDTAGLVGIGTLAPTKRLDVVGGAQFIGTDGELVKVTQTSDSIGADGLVGRHTSTTSSGSVAVLGISASTGNSAVRAEGNFTVTGTKAFLQPHPTDAAKQIHFFCLEGNESGTYFRGKTHLTGSLAVIEVPEDFRLASEPEDMTVQLTAIGPARVWVESYDNHSVRIRGEADVEVHYVVNGVRRGFDDLETIRDNTAFRPRASGQPFGTQYPQALRQILVENGTLNADFTPNEDTAARLGWTLAPAEVKREAVRTNR